MPTIDIHITELPSIWTDKIIVSLKMYKYTMYIIMYQFDSTKYEKHSMLIYFGHCKFWVLLCLNTLNKNLGH